MAATRYAMRDGDAWLVEDPGDGRAVRTRRAVGGGGLLALAIDTRDDTLLGHGDYEDVSSWIETDPARCRLAACGGIVVFAMPVREATVAQANECLARPRPAASVLAEMLRIAAGDPTARLAGS